MLKNLYAMWGTWVWSLCWEDPLEKGMATHSTPVFWPGEFHELHSPWGHKQADRTQRLSLVTVLESQKHHVHKGRDWRENMCVQRGPCFSHWGHPSPQPRDQRWLCARPAPQRLLLEMVGHPGTSHRCGRARRRLGGTGGGDRALGE